MSLMIYVILFSLFFFTNSLFYISVLLVITVLFLFFLAYNYFLSSLVMLMFLIIYVGAMIILIGYVCAVCPNMVFLSNFSFNYNTMFLYFLGLLCLGFYINLDVSSFGVLSSNMSDYFYTSFGMLMFLVLVFMLFLTLLMVTSQYMSPSGPFRSVF